jgi:hypothetical protein
MIKIKDMSLVDLYARPKMTTAIEAAIKEKEDFSRIQPEYCSKVCRMKCKSYTAVSLAHTEVDVLIIQDHKATKDQYKDAEKLEKANRGVLDELCRENLSGLRYRLVDLLKCPITERDMTRGNKPPTTVTQLKCSPYLLEEIRRSKPKVIVSLGGNTTKALGLKKSNYNNRGEIHQTEFGPVVLTLHPKVTLMIRQNASGKMWGPDYWDVINRDFKKAGMMARGEMKVPTLDESIETYKEVIYVARSLEDVAGMMTDLMALDKNHVVSFDTETTGLDPWSNDAKLITIQFGFRNSKGQLISFVIPLWHRDNTWYNPDEAWKHVAPFLVGDQPKVGHNSKFDVLYIYATKKVRVNRIVFDTLLVLHNLNSGIQGNYGLKQAVWDWIPETGLGGYEERLPKLTKVKDDEEEESEEELEG